MREVLAIALAGLTAIAAGRTAATSSAVSDQSKESPMESAKRRTPGVKPLIVHGVRYEPLRRADEHGFTQSGGVLAAVDDKSGKFLWAVQLYNTDFDEAEERDVQEVYIQELSFDKKAGAVRATDERKRSWLVDPTTRTVTPQPAP